MERGTVRQSLTAHRSGKAAKKSLTAHRSGRAAKKSLTAHRGGRAARTSLTALRSGKAASRHEIIVERSTSSLWIELAKAMGASLQGEVAKAANLRSAILERAWRAMRAGCPRSQLCAAASGGRNRGIEFHASFSGQQALPDSRVMKMTNGYRECVRCVVWFGN